MRGWVLFQHNVETVIWERHAQSGRTALHRSYFSQQARRMFEWERAVCRASAHVVAVSKIDEQIMRERFAIEETSSVATGVDLDYFEAPAGAQLRYDLVFLGSMDWMPNISGVQWFLSEVLPLIKAEKPDVRVAVVGRNPPPSLASLADVSVTVTGTVPDVRPYLWESAISIVPLQIGGGTRLKIFEAMAAETAVISTTVGAEGLPVSHGETIRIADDAHSFAHECLDLLNHPGARTELARNALTLIQARFSWAQVTRDFEETLRSVHASVARFA
jgi:glycosyltransferase involved in cell wall biosynthesis